MIVQCQACGKSYRVDEARLKGKARVKVRCAGCKAVIDVAVPKTAAAAAAAESPSPVPEGDRTAATQASEVDLAAAVAAGQAGAPQMPPMKRVTLAILSGSDQGKLVHLSGPRLVIGRSEGDLLLDDAEASRRHAVVEVYGLQFLVRDLGSTNGTFVDGERIASKELSDRDEFQIGGTRMMLFLTDPYTGSTPES